MQARSLVKCPAIRSARKTTDMINGFEEETAPLTDYEKTLVKHFVKGLENRKDPVSNTNMIKGLKLMGIKDITPARVRKIINYIRMNHIVRNLVASSKGYYVENDPKKLKEYINSLHQRADAILAVARSYKN